MCIILPLSEFHGKNVKTEIIINKKGMGISYLYILQLLLLVCGRSKKQIITTGSPAR